MIQPTRGHPPSCLCNHLQSLTVGAASFAKEGSTRLPVNQLQWLPLAWYSVLPAAVGAACGPGNY